MSGSGEHRRASDTIPLDQGEIAKAMAKAEAEANAADPPPEAPLTTRLCPSCMADADVAATCTWCTAGVMTFDQFASWRDAHPHRL